MARKSRKQNNQVKLLRHKPTSIQVAAYVRLSLEEQARKGISIETQQHIISRYIDEHPDLELYDTYIDLGVSGTTFERPSFQRMLRDAEAKKIQCIIVKDLSRLGRDTIDTGYYAEQAFPRLGLRLISIGDNYDSSIYNGGITVPFINLINEAYVLDIRRKTRSQSRQAMKDGIYVGGRPPYGYMRVPDNRCKLIVDAPAADIVKQIFECALEGMSMSTIARTLNASKVPSPAVHKSSVNTESFGVWHTATISKILDNEIYLGHLVQGKTKSVYSQRQRTPNDEWVRAYDVHEAIITPAIFQAVQALKQKNQVDPKRKSTVSYSTNIYKGKIYCAHCGSRLERTKQRDMYIFRCTTKRTAPDSCGGNRIAEDAVTNALSEQLLQLKDDLSRQLDIPSGEKDLIDMELHHLQNLLRSLYENLVTGVIDQTDFSELKKEYQIKTDEYKQRAIILHRSLDDEKNANKRRQESLRILNIFADTSVLTVEHVERFVSRLIIFEENLYPFK